MPKQLINGITLPEAISTQIGVYIIFALTLIIISIWLITSYVKSRGLVNHPNAVCLRALAHFLRTAEKENNQLNTLYELLTKTKNDIVMLFSLYCRIHNNFSYIEHYLNYRSFKRINTKQKPWGFTIIIIFALANAVVFSISYYIGLQSFINMQFNISDLLLSFAVPFGLCLIWLVTRVAILMKYKMYWVEFENLFRKVNTSCSSFFKSQEQYFEEFSENILSGLIPTGGIKRRIEFIISTTDPNSFEKIKMYTPQPTRKKGKEDMYEAKQPSAPSADDTAQKALPPQMMPSMPGVRILKPHPETEAYMQAQAQITTQLMQMMMQQGMQQSQVIQRALSSQQALANSVVQQNIMAMRLEAQQTSLLRPDIAKKLSEQTYTWPSSKITRERETEKEFEESTAEADSTIEPDNENNKTTIEVSTDETEIQGKASAKPKDEKALMAQKLQNAFEMLSPPPSADKEPDPTFPEPDRDLTHVEKRLAQLLSGKVYIYD